MNRLRWSLVALLVASTALFAVGVIAERSDAGERTEPPTVHTQEGGESVDEPEGAHSDEGGTRAVHAETDETLLGIDVESTPLVVLAVLVGLALAALAATRFGEHAGVLSAIAVIALVWAALDFREVLHQADESRTGLALVAAAVVVLHLVSAAVAGRLAALAGRADVGSPARPGTIPA
jgi:hypothetical protein